MEGMDRPYFIGHFWLPLGSKKCYEDKPVDFQLIGEKDKKYYVLIKVFNTFMYEHTLHVWSYFTSWKKNTFAVIVYKLLVQKKC